MILMKDLNLEEMEAISYYAQLKLANIEQDIRTEAEKEEADYYAFLKKYENDFSLTDEQFDKKTERKRYFVERVEAFEEAMDALKKAEEAFRFLFTDKEYFDKL